MKVVRLSKLIFIILIAACAAIPAFSRIGESKMGFEGRLLSKSGGAYKYPSREDNLREAQELPYKILFFLMPRGMEHCFYFKRADDKLATDGDVIMQHELYGWELHTAFLNGKSVLEFYRRHGDPMTVEELKMLMELMAPGDGKTNWVRSNFVPIVRRWDLQFDNGNARSFILGSDGKPVPDSANKENLKNILPENPVRFIYVDVPEDVQRAVKYNLSLTYQLMDIEQQKRYEAYRDYLARQSAYNAAKSAPKSSRSGSKKSSKSSSQPVPQKVNVFNGNTYKGMESLVCDIESSLKGGNNLSLYKYFIDDVQFGGSPIVRNDKQVMLTMKIPLQPDTAFGYSYELSDASVRAKLYKNGILFIDAKFDKFMRDFMEKLYGQQEGVRKEEAKSSVSRF